MPDMPDPIVWGWVYAIVRLEPHWTNRICDYKAMEDKLTFFLKQRCEHRPIILRQFCQYRQGASPELIKKDVGYGLKNLLEEGLEACNKILRRIRERLARKNSEDNNLRDFLARSWMMSDPCVYENSERIKPYYQMCEVRGHFTIQGINAEV